MLDLYKNEGLRFYGNLKRLSISIIGNRLLQSIIEKLLVLRPKCVDVFGLHVGLIYTNANECQDYKR